MATDSFSVGDKVVYPGHGVGQIDAIVSTSVSGSAQECFNISLFEKKDMKILVPVQQAQTRGLRRIIDKRSVEKVYDILKNRSSKKVDTQTWNRRFREYSQKIQTGSAMEIAEVLRDLSILSAGKELSFGEKRMFETAQKRLVSEIAVAKSRTQEKVLIEIQSLFQ